MMKKKLGSLLLTLCLAFSLLPTTAQAATVTATPNASTVQVNRKDVDLEAYTISGSNYFKLRDLMEKIQVYVGWDGAKNRIVIDLMRPYEHIPANTLEPAPTADHLYYISNAPKGGEGLTPGRGQFAEGIEAVFEGPTPLALRGTAEPGYYTLSCSTVKFIAYVTAPDKADGTLTYQRKAKDSGEGQMFALVSANSGGGYYLQTKRGQYVQNQVDAILTPDKAKAEVLYFQTPEFTVPPQVEAPQLKADAHYFLAGDIRDGKWCLMPFDTMPGTVVGIMPFRTSMTLVPDGAAPGWFHVVYDTVGAPTYLTVENGAQKAMTVLCIDRKKGDDSQRFQFVKMSSNGGYYLKTTEGFYVREFEQRTCLTGEMVYAHPFYFLEKAG